MTKPTWEEYLMSFAIAASKRGTCDRKLVGAVVVQQNRVITTGYNGSVSGLPHCDDEDHDMVKGHCVRTIHAEMNALTQAAKFGMAVDGASIYTTASPCWDCFRVLANAGIRLFVYAEDYRGEDSMKRIEGVCEATGIVVRKLGMSFEE